MKDISKALKMRYKANISLREIAIATKLPHTTISDYCKRFDNSGYDLDVLLSFNDDKITSILFPTKKIVQKNFEKPMPDVEVYNNNDNNLDKNVCKYVLEDKENLKKYGAEYMYNY